MGSNNSSFKILLTTSDINKLIEVHDNNPDGFTELLKSHGGIPGLADKLGVDLSDKKTSGDTAKPGLSKTHQRKKAFGVGDVRDVVSWMGAFGKEEKDFLFSCKRDYEWKPVKYTEVVVGDVIALENGNVVPSYALLVDNACTIQVDVEHVTGESCTRTINKENPLVRPGELVVDGKGQFLVLWIETRNIYY